MVADLLVALPREGSAVVDRSLRDWDVAARAFDVRVTAAWLDEAVVAAWRTLPRGTDRLAVAGVRGAGRAGPTFSDVLDSWLRGDLASWLDESLSAARVRDQGVLDPAAVRTALARWRARTHGWTARHVFLLAHLVRWIESRGLRREERA
jgi:hypothetical protein